MSQLNIDNIANQLGTGGPDFVGMPTVGGDPVVESGSNSDGSWTRFAEGTQIVRRFFLRTDAIATSDVHVGYKSSPHALLFPIPFDSTEYQTAVMSTGESASGATTVGGTSSAAGFSFVYTSHGSSAGSGSRGVFFIIVGRWK